MERRGVPPDVRPTHAVETYVKAMYGLGERGVAVTTTGLAAEVGVTAASASAMLARLRELGLITHRPYSEASLSDAGRRLALQVIRRRRLIESFLIETLDYSWDEVEREAEVFSQTASELFVDRIAAKLGHPIVDPHGDPIPGPGGEILAAQGQLLADLEAGTVGRLVRVWNGDPEVLRYLDSCEIALGDRIEVLGHEPFGGPLMVRVGEPKEGRILGLGVELAAVLSIEVEW